MLQPLNRQKFLIILMLGLLIPAAGGYILDVPPKPDLANDSIPYLDDFIVPKEVEDMQTAEIYQTFVILSMLTVNMLKTFGMYLMMKRTDPELKFNPAYIVSGLLGVFMGYAAFVPQMTYEGTYINIFMQAGFYALGANLMFDFAGKIKEKSTKNER